MEGTMWKWRLSYVDLAGHLSISTHFYPAIIPKYVIGVGILFGIKDN